MQLAGIRKTTDQLSQDTITRLKETITENEKL